MRNSVLQSISFTGLVEVIIFVSALIHISVHHTHRQSNLCYITCLRIIILVECSCCQQTCLIFSQFQYFILIERNIEISCPRKILGSNILSTQAQFQTIILHLSDILCCTIETRRQRHRGIEQKITCDLTINICGKVDSFSEEAQVYTHIPLFCSFPFKVIITYSYRHCSHCSIITINRIYATRDTTV